MFILLKILTALKVSCLKLVLCGLTHVSLILLFIYLATKLLLAQTNWETLE